MHYCLSFKISTFLVPAIALAAVISSMRRTLLLWLSCWVIVFYDAKLNCELIFNLIISARLFVVVQSFVFETLGRGGVGLYSYLYIYNMYIFISRVIILIIEFYIVNCGCECECSHLIFRVCVWLWLDIHINKFNLKFGVIFKAWLDLTADYYPIYICIYVHCCIITNLSRYFDKF